ncbi:hypothetical protein [Zoogloea sp.]|uniref:hypothetical protein n=1 Tax=Zoogloea sp. TaxID=49181 RepID=UPI0035ADEF49
MEFNFDPIAVTRMALIYIHVLALAVAAVAVGFGDYAIFARERVNMRMLEQAARFATLALGLLWVSGLAVIVLDIGLDLDVLASKPKLLAKLSVVTVLTINSLALHFLAFPRFATPQADTLQAATLPSIFGAVSAASWLYAAFVGVAKPLAAVLGFSGFMSVFGALIVVSVALAVLTIRPRLASRLIPAPMAVGGVAAA